MFKSISFGLLCVMSVANGQSTDSPMSTASSMAYVCGSDELSSSNSISVALKFDYDASMVYITLQGPDSQYYAVGFGATTMDGTYTIVVDGDGTVSERKLGDHTSGTELTASLTKESDSTSDGVRTVMVSRDITGSDSDYYTFSSYSSSDSLSVIWGTADSITISQHTSKGSSSVTFSETDDGDSTTCILDASTSTSDDDGGSSGSSSDAMSLIKNNINIFVAIIAMFAIVAAAM